MNINFFKYLKVCFNLFVQIIDVIIIQRRGPSYLNKWGNFKVTEDQWLTIPFVLFVRIHLLFN
jgi:hypothetical protein